MGKVLKFKDILAAARSARRAGKKIVATNGCFDILHIGHVRNLQSAKQLGDILIVGINSDASVRRNKGPSRPIIKERERAELLAALGSVDYVFIFGAITPNIWIKKLRPHIHVKGGGDDIRNHPDIPAQKRAIESGGGRLIFLPHLKGFSTTDVICRILRVDEVTKCRY